MLTCHFCSGRRAYAVLDAGRVPVCYVWCPDCEARGPTAETKGEARELWGNRAARGFDAAVEAIETWANGFYSVRTAKYLRSTATDLRRERDNILAALSNTEGLTK